MGEGVLAPGPIAPRWNRQNNESEGEGRCKPEMLTAANLVTTQGSSKINPFCLIG